MPGVERNWQWFQQTRVTDTLRFSFLANGTRIHKVLHLFLQTWLGEERASPAIGNSNTRMATNCAGVQCLQNLELEGLIAPNPDTAM
jgi:hypothetical protein